MLARIETRRSFVYPDALRKLQLAHLASTVGVWPLRRMYRSDRPGATRGSCELPISRIDETLENYGDHTMKLGKILAAATAATLAVAPMAAQADVRTSAPVEGESQVGGYSLLALFAIVAIGIGVAASGDDDDAVSA